MANVIETVQKYLPILDAQYKVESKSAILDTPAEFVRLTKEAKKFKIAKIDVDGLADYSRNGGFTAGNLDLSWEEHAYTIDRGRALQVDALDDMETFGMAFGRLAGEFQRRRVIPELDAYRFAKYYQEAGTKVALTVTAGAILKFIDEADAQMDDEEVPENDRILFVNPQVFKLMINDPAIVKHISIEGGSDKTVNKMFYYYDTHLIIKVPSARFYTAVTLYDGTTSGQEKGGYIPAAGASVIGMLMIQKNSIIQVAKRLISRHWAPTKAEADASGADGVNPSADAWKFDFRNYHDAWALEEKIAGIYAATISGDGIEYIDYETGTYDSTEGVWTAGGTTYNLKVNGTTMNILGEIPYEEADVPLGLDAGNRVQVRLANSSITAQADLPSGDICAIEQDNGTYSLYTKAAFEADGSLLVLNNVNARRVKALKVTWVTGKTVTYYLNTNSATLEAAE